MPDFLCFINILNLTMPHKYHRRKHYIKEGGICKFWDDWSNGGFIDYQKLINTINKK